MVTENRQKTWRNISDEKSSFLWFSLFRDVVRRFRKTNEAREGMLCSFRMYFLDNPTQLEKLTSFEETYENHHALWWYSNPDIKISEAINKRLRARDVDALFDMRYFIVDLFTLLQEQSHLAETVYAFRGVVMDKVKFNQLRESMTVGNSISMRGFLSTTLKREIAEMFGSNDTHEPNTVCS